VWNFPVLLNRVHPGKPDGTLTEKISYGLFQLVKTEGIDMVLDMHEAGTKSRLSNTLVCNPKNIDMGAMAVLDMEALGINFKLEQSSDEFRGLSHKEFGDLTDALAFLSETPNPAQDRGKTDPDTADNPEFRLDRRVAVQVYTFLTLCNYLEMFTNNLLFITMVGSFVGLAALRLPISIALLFSSIVGAVISDTFSISRLVEGAFGYFDAILIIATAMIFMNSIKESGLLKDAADVITFSFRRYPRTLLIMMTLFIMSAGMITGSSTAAVLTTGAIAFPVLTSLGLELVREWICRT